MAKNDPKWPKNFLKGAKCKKKGQKRRIKRSNGQKWRKKLICKLFKSLCKNCLHLLQKSNKLLLKASTWSKFVAISESGKMGAQRMRNYLSVSWDWPPLSLTPPVTSILFTTTAVPDVLHCTVVATKSINSYSWRPCQPLPPPSHSPHYSSFKDNMGI